MAIYIKMKTIQIENLKFSYDGEKMILNGISFEIGAGEMIGVIGDSGCGKSTLCHILCGIIPNVIGGDISGKAVVGGKDLRNCNMKDLAQTVGFVMQDSDRQIVTSTVEDELAFGPENLCLPPEEICRRVNDTLEMLELTDIREANPNRLSGGQKQMVTIGSVITMDPDIFILDEPFSHLDGENRDSVSAVLRQLKSAGKTILIVEHDHRMVEEADNWLLLQNGEIKAFDTPEKVREYL